jgi:hypothetical protein
VLAILVWHFYQIFFDPDVYPMNWAWWDGKMPVEQYRHEHELDTETLREAQAKAAASEQAGPAKENAAQPEAGPPKK